MRITGGAARGIPLKLPAKGEIRPATDYLREAVFSSLGPQVQARCVLDVFAGTGAYGLEAISRGAQFAVWVDKNRAAMDALSANRAAVAKSLGVANPETLGRIACADIFVWEPATQVACDLIFADPPYGMLAIHGEKLLRRLLGWLPAGGILVLEASGEFVIPDWAQKHNFKRLSKGPHQPSACFFKACAVEGD